MEDLGGPLLDCRETPACGYPKEDIRKNRSSVEEIIALLTLIAGGAISSFAFESFRRLVLNRETSLEDSRQDRIDRLSSVLREAVTLISELDTQISSGQEKAAKLQEEIKMHESIATLTREQTRAVSLLLGNTLDQDRRQNSGKEWGATSFSLSQVSRQQLSWAYSRRPGTGVLSSSNHNF